MKKLLFLLLLPMSVFAKDNVLTWTNGVDARAQFTQIEYCEGTLLQCSAAGASWVSKGRVDLPGSTFTDVSVREGVNHSYRAGYGNVDFPPANYAGPVDIYVPFGGAPSTVPSGLGVQ